MRVPVGMTPQALRAEVSRLTDTIIRLKSEQREKHKREVELLRAEIKGLEAQLMQRDRDMRALKVLLNEERQGAKHA